ncbi:MAG: MFS transporter [Acidimicrobiales bacterium]|nr:MFS transporter [Acidimicrobiales bacterium]
MDPSVELIRRNRAFAWYWAGQGCSSLGSQISAFALPLVTALTLDGSPGEVGAVASAAMLPYLLFSLMAGHWLEGRQGRRTMIPANLVQAIAVGLVPIAAWGGWLSVPLLAVLAFVSGTAAMVFGLSAFAYVPSLVPRADLAAANRAVQGTSTVDEIIGPGLAGALVAAVGPAAALVVDALSYLASMLGLAAARPMAQHSTQPRSATEKASEKVPVSTGLRILLRDVHLRALTVHAALYNLAEEIFLLNLVLWAIKEQDVTESAFGAALTAAGLGGLLGTLTALRLAGRLGFGRAFAASLVLSCFIPLLAGVWSLTGGALASYLALVMLISAVGLGNANVYSLTMRQLVIPEGQLSRSAGAYTQVMYGSIPIGAALAGLIGETLGTRAGVLVGATGLAISALPMMTRRIRALDLDHMSSRPAATDDLMTSGDS